MGRKDHVPRPRELKQKSEHVALEPGPAPQVGRFLFLNSPRGALLFFDSYFVGKVALELGPAPDVAFFVIRG